MFRSQRSVDTVHALVARFFPGLVVFIVPRWRGGAARERHGRGDYDQAPQVGAFALAAERAGIDAAETMATLAVASSRPRWPGGAALTNCNAARESTAVGSVVRGQAPQFGALPWRRSMAGLALLIAMDTA